VVPKEICGEAGGERAARGIEVVIPGAEIFLPRLPEGEQEIEDRNIAARAERFQQPLRRVFPERAFVGLQAQAPEKFKV